jgi:hypothetical protein
MVEHKQDVVNEIRGLQGLPSLLLSRGSSIPHEFFLDIAREMGIPIFGTMPQYARAIIENSGMEWLPSYSSEVTKSGGGSTVTYDGLCAVRDAFVLWQSQDEEKMNYQWAPPEDWHELRKSEVERELASVMRRPNSEEFRASLLIQYSGMCAISSTSLSTVIEAAHVVPYFGPISDVPQNGLPLRVDLHRAFDAGLFDLNIDLSGNLFVSWISDAMAPSYGDFRGKVLNSPIDSNCRVSEFALSKRREFLKLNFDS